MTHVQTKNYAVEHLREFTVAVFQYFGLPVEDARLATEVLETSDVRGIDSHGVARLSAYTEMLEAGHINPHPKIDIVRQSPSTATVDGDNGLGLVVGPRAQDIALEKADQVGSGWVSVRHTNHFGIAGYYPLQALKRDMIGWAMTNTTALVTPLWGAERQLGTNPLAIAFPADQEPPVVIDLATSAVAYGKIEIAQRKQQPIPAGWAIDRTGADTTDPADVAAGGALLPLGSDRDHGGHKGYCLAAAVDLLSSVLSGANWGPFAPAFTLSYPMPQKSVGRGIGHFFGAMRIDGFMEVEEFKSRVDQWVQVFRRTKPAPGTDGPLIPGDPERLAEATRREGGIPLLLPVVEDLQAISKKTGIPFD